MTDPTGCSEFVQRTTACLDHSDPGWPPSSSPLPWPYQPHVQGRDETITIVILLLRLV